MPRASPTIGFVAWNCAKRFSTFRPISAARAARLLVSMNSIAASAAAQATGLPTNVPPSPPGCALSMISARPVTALIGRPPPSDLAVTTRSGSSPVCSLANILPVRQKPVCTSSATSRMPFALHIRASTSRYSGGAGMNPPSPSTGSITTQATRSAATWVSKNSASSAS